MSKKCGQNWVRLCKRKILWKHIIIGFYIENNSKIHFLNNIYFVVKKCTNLRWYVYLRRKYLSQSEKIRK